ncbi:hypothetical protein [Plantactinospora sp. B5E13]|uniref:hypothetical protein n=1 Tax=Plantactinospora sp. B5E13 TaxID=3153758 RepID=UPI00325F19BB
MTNNSSPHFDRSRRERQRPASTDRSAPSEPYAELFAALDRADVSEAVRSALAHALIPPPGHVATTAEQAGTIQTGDDSGLGLRSVDAGDIRRRYTLHLTFPASSLRVARGKAAAYAEALVALRPELSVSPALLSRADQWNHLEPVSCGRPGPVGVTCVRATGHSGCHRESTAGGLCWDGNEPTGDRAEDRTDGNRRDDGADRNQGERR